jgi:predicted PurR-regulated permease PerM
MADQIGAGATPPHGDPSSSPSPRSLTGLVVAVVVIAALYFGQEVLLPVTIAVLLGFVLSPLVISLRKLRISHVVTVIFSVAVALSFMGGLA